MESPQVLIVSSLLGPACQSLHYLYPHQVGSGPSGLILALSLLKNDIHVRIIEKRADSKVGDRGTGIMASPPLIPLSDQRAKHRI